MVIQSIKQTLEKLQQSSKVVVGFSGGVDSHVLLHALSTLKKEYCLDIMAVHIHHGLLKEADEWSVHCKQVCETLGIPYQVKKVNLKINKGESVEAVARQARYQAFKDLMEDDDVLVVAHHQDDQAETFLMQLLRGAGLKGLSAMPVFSKFGQGYILRPFLLLSRDDILAYAKDHQLKWIEDNSNHDMRFDRNFMRQKIMPLLLVRWPGLGKTISRATQHIAESNDLLQDFAKQVIESVRGKSDGTLSIKKLKVLSQAEQKNILRYWFDEKSFLMPNEKHLQHIIQDVIYAKQDSKSCVSWRDAEVRRYQDDIYVMKPIEQFDSKACLKWDYQKPLQLPGELGLLKSELILGRGIDADLLTAELEVRFRQGGESCRLPGRQGTHLLKKLFQEWQVPYWKRDRIPLLYHQSDLVAVVGFAVCESYQVPGDEEGIVIKRCQAS